MTTVAYLWYPFPGEHVEKALADCLVLNPQKGFSIETLEELTSVPPKHAYGNLVEGFIQQVEFVPKHLILELFTQHDDYRTEVKKEHAKLLAQCLGSDSSSLWVLATLYMLLRTSIYVSTTSERATLEVGPQLMMCKQLGVTTLGLGESPRSMWFQAMFDYTCRPHQLPVLLSCILEGRNGSTKTYRENPERGEVRSS